MATFPDSAFGLQPQVKKRQLAKNKHKTDLFMVIIGVVQSKH